MKIIIPNLYVSVNSLGFLLLLFFIFVKADKSPLSYPHEPLHKNKTDSVIISLNKEISKSKTDIDKAFIFIELGNAYKLKQQYEKSFQVYQNALGIFRYKKMKGGQFYVYTQLAELYRYRRLFEKAEEYISLCENILKKEKVKDIYLMKFFSRKAALFSEYGNNGDSALIYSRRSLAIAQKAGDFESELISLMEIASIYERKKNFLEAIQQFNKIINLAEEKADIQVQCDAMVNLARNLNSIKKYKASIDVSLSGFVISEKNKLNYNQLLFADNLQSAYGKTGDYKNAHKYLLIRLRMTEDYYHKLYDDKVLEYEEKFKFAEKQKIINENEKLLALNEEEIKRQNLIKYFILSGLVLILIFAVVLLYIIKIIRKQNKELTFVSEQNEFLVSETHHRINNNLQMITILIESELKKNPNTDELSNKRIIAKIDSLGILHRQLYKSKDKKNLDLNIFLTEVRQNLDFLFSENKIDVSFEIKNLVISVNNAMYIGLLVTELCINSLKHAFPNQENKKIKLKIYTDKSNIYFIYADNGAVKNEIPKLKLIEKLCRQLRIEPRVNVDKGFEFSFNMKL